jgi:hypothetical protein
LLSNRHDPSRTQSSSPDVNHDGYPNCAHREDDVSLPFDGHYDAISKIADLFYEAFKVSEGK